MMMMMLDHRFRDLRRRCRDFLGGDNRTNGTNGMLLVMMMLVRVAMAMLLKIKMLVAKIDIISSIGFYDTSSATAELGGCKDKIRCILCWFICLSYVYLGTFSCCYVILLVFVSFHSRQHH